MTVRYFAIAALLCCGSARAAELPNTRDGLPPDEITIAEALKARGYATAAIGKWHLGHRPAYLPRSQGFDSYFGIPYSNDMNRTADAAIAFSEPKIEYFDVPLMRDTEIVERPADQATITRRYTGEALSFIRRHRDESFFLYVAYSLPHVLSYGEQGGSAGLLRGGKGMTWEGGMREPAIAWWPGTVAAGRVQTAVTSTLDLFPTAVAMAGAELPTDRIIDGRNLLPMLEGRAGPPTDAPFFYYRGTRIYAVRKGPYKAHFDIAVQHPEIVADLVTEVARHRANLTPHADQLAVRDPMYAD